MFKSLRIGFLGLVIMATLAACGSTGTTTTGTNATSSTSGSSATTPAATMAATMMPAATMSATMMPAATDATMSATAMGSTAMAGGAVSGKLTVAGSSALLPMMQEAAKEFQAKNSGAQITVTAGGSGAGRTQVCSGQIDIGDSDVKLSSDERTKLNCANAVETPVAIQAFAPVANKKGPGSVNSLTKDQLVKIFNGTTKNWKEVGGDDQPIVLVNRAKGSGTRSNMAKFLFAGDDKQFATGQSEEDNSETVRQTVSQAPGAISYLGFAYLTNPDIIAFSVDGVKADKADIQSGAWKIGGPGYAITKGPGSPLAQSFLQFVTSPDFQNSDAFGKLGFVPVK